jgi:hypothetical protein
MAFDLAAWVKELGLTEEEQKVVEPVFKNRLDKLEGNQLRQGEFSRKMNELQTERDQALADLRQRAEAVNQDYTRLGTWETEVKDLRKKDLADLQRHQERVAQLESRMRRLAYDHGIPENELGLELPPTAVPAPAGPAPPDERYLTREDWERHRLDLNLLPDVDAEMNDIVDDVRDLMGTRIRRRDLLKELQEANSKLLPTAPRLSMRQFAEQKYKLAEKRLELEEKKQKERDDRIRSEEATRIRSELNIANPRPADNRRSPVLERAAASAATNNAQQPGYKQPTGVARAVQAYNEGKYRQVQ